MISLEEIGTRARGAEPVLRIMGTETSFLYAHPQYPQIFIREFLNQVQVIRKY